MLVDMGMTTIKIETRLRDRIALVAREHYEGATLAETLNRLVDEHLEQRVMEQYAKLQEDPEAWADYLSETGEWERAAAADAARHLSEVER